ncbi:MAG: GTPase ObgE [Bdellovibrionota bacterium]
MKFIDEVVVDVRSGNGGPGAVHFRREKYRPRMGPDGGNGGKGGDVYFVATTQAQSLLDFKYISRYAAEDGVKGGGAGKDGRYGEDLVIQVPVGTLVFDAETGVFLADLVEDGKKALLIRGGRGGLGNIEFATAVRQAPEYAQPGEPGRALKIRMELKLLADVALIGFPNAGKSTLISKWSAARPKIGDYPFTTLVPNLGVVRGSGVDFVLADIPGIIEGASDGKGLGHQFLRHAERTRALLMLLDLDPYTGRNLGEEFRTLVTEMRAFSEELAKRPLFIALSKADAFGITAAESLETLAAREDLAEKGLAELIEELKIENLLGRTFVISSASGFGLDTLKERMSQVLLEMGPRVYENQVAQIVSFGNMNLFDEPSIDEDAEDIEDEDPSEVEDFEEEFEDEEET